MNLLRTGALTALALVMASGCGSSGESSPETVKVIGPDGGVIEAPPPPPAPEVGGTPRTGVFVSSSTGLDTNDGTMARPLRTLAAALTMAQERKDLPVIACAENYAESLKLIDGVTVYGYFDCSGPEWKRVSAKARLESPTSPAVLAENLALPARFEGFTITAPAIVGTPESGTPAGSVYGMIVRATKNLVLGELDIQPGMGQNGISGVEPAEGNVELSTGVGGGASSPQAAQSCSGIPVLCNFGQTYTLPGSRVVGASGGSSRCKVGANGGGGGQGGSGRVSVDGVYQSNWASGDERGRPFEANATTAAGGQYQVTGWGGANGANGAKGTTGAVGKWAMTDTGFTPGDGTAGTNGQPGQGGGGGAGSPVWWLPPTGVLQARPATNPPASGNYMMATGGGGGAGGCGGVAGTAGTGGGASIGLFVVGSENITLARSRIRSGKGGGGGRGTLGTAGLAGGAGGAMGPGLSGGAGGNGGAGGAGGLSGPGAPGPSIAMAFRGARPSTNEVELIPGEPGDGAPEITHAGQTMPAAIGETLAELEF